MYARWIGCGSHLTTTTAFTYLIASVTPVLLCTLVLLSLWSYQWYLFVFLLCSVLSSTITL
ncbi:hypothetical protein OG21DRAFT_1503904 [Imleria badia]|nr:hypothetical protein OG21DRAFT_1503904 [Imleria badia]